MAFWCYDNYLTLIEVHETADIAHHVNKMFIKRRYICEI